MSLYKNILIGLELHPNFDKSVVDKAIQFAKQHNAKITLIHVVEHLTAYGMAQAYPAVVGIEQELCDEAKTELNKIIEHYHLKNADIRVELGAPKHVIIDCAEQIQADLIIVGSHGRHGIGLLLGSTANAILHHAPCDVLAVRLK